MKFNKVLVEQVEKMLPNHKTLMIYNSGSWHLQGPFPFIIPKGTKDPYNTNGAFRNRALPDNKDYMPNFVEKLSKAFAEVEAKSSKNALWVWRTMVKFIFYF